MISSTEIEIPGIMIVYEPRLAGPASAPSPTHRGYTPEPDVDEEPIVIIFSNN